jgi:hypothetical protein
MLVPQEEDAGIYKNATELTYCTWNKQSRRKFRSGFLETVGKILLLSFEYFLAVWKTSWFGKKIYWVLSEMLLVFLPNFCHEGGFDFTRHTFYDSYNLLNAMCGKLRHQPHRLVFFL